MTRRSISTCVEPGCPELTREKRCPKHAKAYDAKHRGNFRDVYRSVRWQVVRRKQLHDQPWCAASGCRELATEVDHIVRMEDGGPPFHPNNLQSLCKPHHSSKTARELFHEG